MAGEQNTPAESSRNQLREFRRVVGNVVGELRSQEVRDTYAAVTLVEVLDQQLTMLSGTSRIPSRKQRLTKMYDEFNATIEAIKGTSPDAFRQHDPNTDVNTAP
jgi:hypothetical protein